MTEQNSDSGQREQQVEPAIDPAKRERVAAGMLDVMLSMHRDEVETRTGEKLPNGIDLRDVHGRYQADLRRAAERAVLADTEGGSYDERRAAAGPLTPWHPGEPTPFPGGAKPPAPPAERPQR